MCQLKLFTAVVWSLAGDENIVRMALGNAGRSDLDLQSFWVTFFQLAKAVPGK